MKTLVANPKRRWILAIIAIVVVAGGVVFVAFREEPKDDSPRLVVVRQQQVNGQNEVAFRLDAHKHIRTWVVTMAKQNPFTGEGHKPMLHVAGNTNYAISERNTQHNGQQRRDFVVEPPLAVEAGRSKEFKIIAPPDEVWRLHCDVVVECPVTTALPEQVRWCWKYKSLRPLGWGVPGSMEIVDSELITNAVARSADAPAR